MIEIYLKYDNMNTFGIINAFNYMNNHVNSCINSMLLTQHFSVVVKTHKRRSNKIYKTKLTKIKI